MLVGVILGPTVDAALQEMGEIKGRVDAAEIRLDFFDQTSLTRLSRLRAEAPLPLIFTFRRRGEEELFEKALALGPAFADIEVGTDPSFVERIAKLYPKISLICSMHDFKKTPEDLEAVLESMKGPHFSMYKIAVHANSTLDMMRLMVFGREQSKRVPLSCISMGEYGQPSRVLGPIIGNILNYTSLRDQVGPLFQFNLDTLHDLYRFPFLTRETKIYALLGDPVEESPGAIFHNEIFRREGIHAIYVKFRLTASELVDFFPLASKLPFGGFSVTIPLKEAAVPLLTRVDPTAALIGAVNTVTVRGEEWVGTNTDGVGALNAIEMHGKVSGKRMAILGAGGSARAIAYEATSRKAKVSIFNRTLKRAGALAKEFGCEAHPLDELAAHPYDILVSTIPPNPDGILPIPTTEILAHTLIMDINNCSGKSPLLRAAKEKGCRTIQGSQMFESQAHLQQVEWKRRL